MHRDSPTPPGDGGVGSHRRCETLSSALLVVALLAARGRRILLLLAGLRLPALALLLLARSLAAALLLTGLLVGSLRRLRILVRIIHLSTSSVKIQHQGSNDDHPHYKAVKK
jgi:hypothetical protein